MQKKNRGSRLLHVAVTNHEVRVARTVALLTTAQELTATFVTGP